jgi:hypothetical protein
MERDVELTYATPTVVPEACSTGTAAAAHPKGCVATEEEDLIPATMSALLAGVKADWRSVSHCTARVQVRPPSRIWASVAVVGPDTTTEAEDMVRAVMEGVTRTGELAATSTSSEAVDDGTTLLALKKRGTLTVRRAVPVAPARTEADQTELAVSSQRSTLDPE